MSHTFFRDIEAASLSFVHFIYSYGLGGDWLGYLAFVDLESRLYELTTVALQASY